MSVSCRVVTEAMEKFAPRHLAESWDNVGLIIGNPAQTVTKVLVALDVTLNVARYAADNGYDMIISHHPLIFKGLTSIRTDTPLGETLAILLRKSIAVYASHTNLDVADGGVNDVLAEKLGLSNVQPLSSGYEDKLFKLVVFVPDSHLHQVHKAICEAGAGHIGNYSHCTFQTKGTGTFLPLEGTNPFLGTQGKLEYADETRLETIVPQSLKQQVLAAMRQAHPYEEIAYDWIPLANNGLMYGLGRKGTLPQSLHFTEFLQQLKTALNLSKVTVAGSCDKMVRRVAVCGGSGASLIRQAAQAGADVFITGDVKYHEAQEAVSHGLTVIDAGHFATEQPVIDIVAQYLRTASGRNKWQLIIEKDQVNSDVFQIL